jgi:hypothetical protein
VRNPRYAFLTKSMKHKLIWKIDLGGEVSCLDFQILGTVKTSILLREPLSPSSNRED